MSERQPPTPNPTPRRQPPARPPRVGVEAPDSPRHITPVWFFVGLLLLIYGVIILASGLANWNNPPRGVELTELHAPVWWGAFLTILGAIYSFRFAPRRNETK